MRKPRELSFSHNTLVYFIKFAYFDSLSGKNCDNNSQ